MMRAYPGGSEMQATLLQVAPDSQLASEMGAGAWAPKPLLLWGRPEYDIAGRAWWRLLPGQGPWSGGLLLPLEAELVREGRVAIELREMVPDGRA